MARPLRIEYPGAWYHVTCRGNEGRPIYRDDRDRKKFLDILRESRSQYEVEIHCHVMMLNHFHLLVRTPLGNLSRFMKRFNTTYTTVLNRRHDRCGHLYQGRYKAILVDADSYLLELSRYIHLNPIRVKQMGEMGFEKKKELLWNYKWSSLRGYLDKKYCEDFIRYELVLGMFAKKETNARAAYRSFILDGLATGVRNFREDVKGQTMLGSERFIEWAKKNLLADREDEEQEVTGLRSLLPEVRVRDIAEAVAREYGIAAVELLSRRSKWGEARQMLIELSCRMAMRTRNMKDIALELGDVTISALTHSRRRFMGIVKKNPAIANRLAKVEKSLVSQ